MRLRWPGFRKVRNQVCKRISRRYRELGLDSLDGYRNYLDTHAEEWDVLQQLCRVTISRFYRDRGVFDAIRDRILPQLITDAEAAGRSVLRCWSVGCASGEEAYSLSLCYRLGPAGDQGIELRVTGTDIDQHLLKRARRACYPPGSLEELPDEWIEVALEPDADEFCIRSAYRDGLSWIHQDVRAETPGETFDLILCRNLVFTYYDEALQMECLERIANCLRGGGYLVIGNHESIPPGDRAFTRVDRSEAIFEHVI